MPSLLLPNFTSSSLKNGYQLPPELHAFQWPEAHGVTRMIDSGTVFVQTRTINGFSLAYLIFRMQQRTEVTCETQDASAILHFVLKGILTFSNRKENPETISWPKQQFGLHSYKNGFRLPILIEPGEHHFLQVAFSFNLFSLLMRSTIASQKSESFEPANPIFFSAYSINRSVQKTLSDTLYFLQNDPHEILQLHRMLLQLISQYLRIYDEQERSKTWIEKKQLQFTELENFILNHLGVESRVKLDVSFLARMTKTNLYQFHKLFRQQFGVSLAVYIRQKRMERAVQLLTQTTLLASDIYLLVGYEDLSSFSRAFSNYYGYPPSQLRKGP